MEAKERCFVIRPFAPEFTNTWELAIKPAIERAGLDAWDGQEERLGTNQIHKDISNLIWNARLVVADLSGRNANVMYELGLAHAAKKHVIMLLEEREVPPFDVAHIRYLLYKSSNLKDLHDRLVGRIQSTLGMGVDDQPDFFPELRVITKEVADELFYLRSTLVPIEVTVTPLGADVFFNDKLVGSGRTTVMVNPKAPRNTISASTVGFYEFHRALNSGDIEQGSLRVMLDSVYEEGADIKERIARRLPAWLRDRRRDPHNPALMRAVSNYLLLANERADALQEIEELLAVAPSWHLAFIQRGFYHGVAGEVAEAIPWYERATGLTDSHYIGNYNLACNYTLLGEFERALHHLDLIRCNPKATDCLRAANHRLSRDPDFRGLWENRDTRARYREIELFFFPDAPEPEHLTGQGVQGYVF